MKTVIMLLIWTVSIYCIVRAYKHFKYHRSDVKYFRIYAGVHDLEQLVIKLEELEEIQTSIELARFHRLKGVTINLPDNLSKDHSHTLLINGHDSNSKVLMQLVIKERDKLRKSLTEKIHELEKHGTTQLNPIAVTKELAEVSTMRVRGAHFSPRRKKQKARNAVIKTNEININDYMFLDGGEGENI